MSIFRPLCAACLARVHFRVLVHQQVHKRNPRETDSRAVVWYARTTRLSTRRSIDTNRAAARPTSISRCHTNAPYIATECMTLKYNFRTLSRSPEVREKPAQRPRPFGPCRQCIQSALKFHLSSTVDPGTSCWVGSRRGSVQPRRSQNHHRRESEDNRLCLCWRKNQLQWPHAAGHGRHRQGGPPH